ncbi:MAG: tRNA lysidine(34) synthetase TilS [bacterium]
MSIILNRNLVSEKDIIIIAVSGGIDSMVLLDLLVKARNRLDLTLIVAHVDHQMRSASADDANFVATQCLAYDVPCESMRLEPWDHGNFHEYARKARYDFFLSVAQRHGANKIALAHQADDQAETLLMRIVRGSGLAGYAGMPERATLATVEIIRPLLRISRMQIRNYQKQHDIPYREDESNAENHYTRNRFRHNIMPAIASENPQYLDKFAQFAAYVDEAYAVIARMADAFISNAVVADATGVSFSTKAFRLLEPAVQKDVVKKCYDRLSGNIGELDYSQIVAAIGIASGTKPHASYDLPDGYRLARSYDRIVLARRDSVQSVYSVTITGLGSYPLPDGSMITVKQKPDVMTGISIELWYNNLDLIFPMTVRTRKNGDRITFGYGTKKLKDLFIDQKIPMVERTRMPLLVGKTGTVLWIPELNIKAGMAPGREAIIIQYTRGDQQNA